MISYSICLSLLIYFPFYNTLHIHPCCCRWQNFIPCLPLSGITKINKWDLIKLKSFRIENEIIKITKWKNNLLNGRKHFQKDMTNKVSQFSSIAQSCPTLCDPMDCNTPGFPVHHQLPELAQTHVHRVGDALQPSYPLSSPSLPAFNLYQHQDFSKWVSSLHQVAEVLEFQLQHQSFQWIFRTDFL